MTAEEPKELTSDEKVAKFATMAATATMFVVALLGICSIFLPWWVGSAATWGVSDPTMIGIDASVTLWRMELTLTVPISPSSPDMHTIVMPLDWSTMCQQDVQNRAAACMSLEAARAFSILTGIVALGATLALVAGLKEPLALLGGALLDFLTALIAAVGIVCGLLVDTAGLMGPGFFLMVASAVLSVFSLALTLYAAAKAMPLDDPNAGKEEKVLTRMQRSQAARKEQAKLKEHLEFNLRSHMSRQNSLEEGSLGKGGLEEGPVDAAKSFYHLAAVIEWTQKHGVADGEEIPLELLEEAFREMDTDRSGKLDVDELVTGLRACGLPASQGVVQTLVKDMDKNDSNEIEVDEFVDFFRAVEELDRFQHHAEQRTQFMTIVCSCCFLTHIIIVGVLLMMFIQLDEASTDPQNYSIMRNALLVCAINLGILFTMVILIPAVKLTLGANIVAWRRHYDKRFTKAKKKRPSSDNDAPSYECRFRCGYKGDLKEVQTHEKKCPARGNQPIPQGGLREAGWTGGGDQGATVNAAIFGASYRVKKAQARLAELNRDWRECHNGCGFAGTNEEVSKHEYLCPLRRRASVVEGDDNNGSAPPPPGVILDENGSMQRYDPLAFRIEQMNQLSQHQPRTFVTMASRDTGQQQGGGNERTHNPNMLALEYSQSQTSYFR